MSDKKELTPRPKPVEKETLQPVKPEQEVLDLSQEASIVHQIGMRTDGVLVDSVTGQPIEDFAALISNCKFGDEKAAEELAGSIADAALRNFHFLDFIINASLASKIIVITSHGIANVPTASALLLRGISARLNIWLANNNRQGLYVDSPIPVWVDKEFYQSSDKVPPKLESIVEAGKYKGCHVLFVDDMLVSTKSADEVKQLLTTVGGAEKVFFLFGGALDTFVYAATDGALEKTVALKSIDGSLESLKGLLEHPEEVTVTQRLLKSVLSPENIPQLYDFLSNLPDKAALKLFKAASRINFFARYNAHYKPAIQVLRSVLIDKGWMGEDGVLYRKQKYTSKEAESTLKPHQIATYTLKSKADITPDEAKRYSRMKYCDPAAVRTIGLRMTQSLLHDEVFLQAVANREKIIITASAYGAIATAGAHLTDFIEAELVRAGINVDRIKVERKGQFAKQDFGKLTAEERAAAMKARKLVIEGDNADKVKGATVIAVDDLCATGSHERSMQKLLADSGASKMIACYYIKFTEQLMVNEPDTEEYLNRASAKTVADLIPWIKELQLLNKPSSEKLQYILPEMITKHRQKEEANSAFWRNGLFTVNLELVKDSDDDGPVWMWKIDMHAPDLNNILDYAIEVRQHDRLLETIEISKSVVKKSGKKFVHMHGYSFHETKLDDFSFTLVKKSQE